MTRAIKIDYKELIKNHNIIFLLFVIIYGSIFVAIFSDREFFAFGTETDYLGGFIPEASHVLNGEPLTLDFHPPLYSLLVAFVQSITGDWLITGMTISFLSAFVVLTCAFVFFSDICGRHSAWGAVLGLVGSAIFVRYSALATSDLFFLAIYFSCSMLAAKAILTRSVTLWFLTGVIVACGLLARSNGLSLGLLLLAPWLCCEPVKRRAVCFGYAVAGFLVPVSVWLAYAIITGSQFMPSGNTINLAMTYFSSTDNRTNSDALKLIRREFGEMSLIDVLLHDPVHLTKTYLRDLFRLITWRLQELVKFPLDLFFLPGLMFLILKSLNRTFALFLILALAQLLLVNFKSFEPRLAMFLLPFMGAGVGELFYQVIAVAHGRALKTIAATVLFLAAGAASVSAMFEANATLHQDDAELAEVIPIMRELPGEVVIVSRKPHLSYYASIPRAAIPQVDTQQELNCFLLEQTTLGTVYLYYGSFEQDTRPQFAAFLLSDTPPPWLTVVAQSAVPARWVLYRYEPIGNDRRNPC